LGYDISNYEVLELYKTKYQKLFKYASKFVIVSKHMKQKLIELGCPEEKIVWSPYPPNDFNFKINCKLTSNDFFMMGRFVDKKAPYYSILAFKKVLEKHPNSILNIAGNGELLEMCINLCKYLKIGESVNLLGLVKPNETIKLIENSLCFIQHSITALTGDMEGTPVAILEASASGLPVVSTKHAGIVDVVIDNETGFLVEEHDVDSMSEKMIFLIENKAKAKEMGAAAKKFVYDNFRLEKHIEIVNNLILEVLK